MATITALLPLEQYLQTSYRPDCDYVDDHIEERNMGRFDHSRMQALITAWFVSLEKAWNVLVATEARKGFGVASSDPRCLHY